jgi:hypothetical protein
MKKILTKLLVLLFLFTVSLSSSVKATEVQLNEIKKVALNAFSHFSGKTINESEIVQIIPVMNNDTALFYVLNFEKSFIIISADNIAEPVLGYGLDSPMDFNYLPPGLNYLLDCYKEEIVFAKRQNYKASIEISRKWEDYLEDSIDTHESIDRGVNLPSLPSLYTPGEILTITTWGQKEGYGNDNIPYNHYCPTNVQGIQTIVGCGGVALAQILDYWKCGTHPQGIVNYTPAGFPPININFANQGYSWFTMLSDAANFANAKLLYHCAAAIKSQFGVEETTSSTSNALFAFSNYFGFSNVELKARSSYTDEVWYNLIRSNLDNRRPIFYRGANSNNEGGHAWVIDGYVNKNNGLFVHCNWGWRGLHSGNTWFTLSSFVFYDLGINLNYYHQAILNIYPTYNVSDIILQNLTISSNTYTGHTIKVINCNIQNNANVIFKANCLTEIVRDFEVPKGATLEIKP